MNDIMTRYLRAIAQLGKHGVWSPGDRRRVGDFGTIENGLFNYLGNLRTLGIEFDVEASSSGPVTFSSSGVRTFHVDAEGPATDAPTLVDINFEARDLVYIHAPRVTTRQMLDIFTNLPKLCNQRRWYTDDYLVITRVDEAHGAAIVLSDRAGERALLQLDNAISGFSGQTRQVGNSAFAFLQENVRGPIFITLHRVTPEQGARPQLPGDDKLRRALAALAAVVTVAAVALVLVVRGDMLDPRPTGEQMTTDVELSGDDRGSLESDHTRRDHERVSSVDRPASDDGSPARRGPASFLGWVIAAFASVASAAGAGLWLRRLRHRRWQRHRAALIRDTSPADEPLLSSVVEYTSNEWLSDANLESLISRSD